MEEGPNHIPIIAEETTTITPQSGFVNNGFEDGPQKSDKVNDKHNVRTKNVFYINDWFIR